MCLAVANSTRCRIIKIKIKTKETLAFAPMSLYYSLGLESNTHSHNASLGVLDEFYNFIALG